MFIIVCYKFMGETYTLALIPQQSTIHTLEKKSLKVAVTYPLKIDSWCRWIFLLKWSLFNGDEFVHSFLLKGGVNNRSAVNLPCENTGELVPEVGWYQTEAWGFRPGFCCDFSRKKSLEKTPPQNEPERLGPLRSAGFHFKKEKHTFFQSNIFFSG